MTTIPDPIPFPTQRVERPITVRPLTAPPPGAAQGTGSAINSPAVGGRLDVVDTADLTTARSAATGKLVAARVDRPVDFMPVRPAPPQANAPAGTSGAYTMHTRASDLNTAATGVALGRNLDVTG